MIFNFNKAQNTMKINNHSSSTILKLKAIWSTSKYTKRGKNINIVWALSHLLGVTPRGKMLQNWMIHLNWSIQLEYIKIHPQGGKHQCCPSLIPSTWRQPLRGENVQNWMLPSDHSWSAQVMWCLKGLWTSTFLYGCLTTRNPVYFFVTNRKAHDG